MPILLVLRKKTLEKEITNADVESLDKKKLANTFGSVSIISFTEDKNFIALHFPNASFLELEEGFTMKMSNLFHEKIKNLISDTSFYISTIEHSLKEFDSQSFSLQALSTDIVDVPISEKVLVITIQPKNQGVTKELFYEHSEFTNWIDELVERIKKAFQQNTNKELFTTLQYFPDSEDARQAQADITINNLEFHNNTNRIHFIGTYVYPHLLLSRSLNSDYEIKNFSTTEFDEIISEAKSKKQVPIDNKDDEELYADRFSQNPSTQFTQPASTKRLNDILATYHITGQADDEKKTTRLTQRSSECN